MKTYLPKVNPDQRKWHVVDADGAVLGDDGVLGQSWHSRSEHRRHRGRIRNHDQYQLSVTHRARRIR